MTDMGWTQASQPLPFPLGQILRSECQLVQINKHTETNYEPTSPMDLSTLPTASGQGSQLPRLSLHPDHRFSHRTGAMWRMEGHQLLHVAQCLPQPILYADRRQQTARRDHVSRPLPCPEERESGWSALLEPVSAPLVSRGD